MNKIIQGDCLIKLKELEDNSVDSIVTDPPYHLVSIVKRFGKENSAPAKFGTDGAFSRASKGFMGKDWDGVNEDGIGIAQKVELWKECLRVLKPGGHLLAFSGTRTYHRMASAIEDAGFEVRDMIEWVYGSGFPKSLNIGKAVDKLQGNKREIVGETRIGKTSMGDSSGWDTSENMKAIKESGLVNITKGTSEWEGWGTALKPAHEPICMARKPLAEKTVAENCLKWGTGGINIDESRVDVADGEKEKYLYADHSEGNSNPTVPIVPSNYKRGGGSELGRFPANLVLEDCEEVRECFPDTKSGKMGPQHTRHTDGSPNGIYGKFDVNHELGETYGDSGNASRFFKSIIYQAKASKSERNRGMDDLEAKPMYKADGSAQSLEIFGSTDGGREDRKNNHPTVKPIALMEYLIKMVTPKGGIVLDPFAGSGSTLVAAKQNGYQYIGIEMTEEYIPIIEARLK